MKKILGFVVLMIGLLVTAFLTGCHTIHGVGQDIKAGGNAIENSSGQNR